MAKTKSKSNYSHPTVALKKGEWHNRDTTMPKIELRDPFTQIAQFLQDQGFRKTLAALEAEAEEKNIALDLSLWQQLDEANQGNSPVNLLEMWSHVFLVHLLPSLAQEENRQRGSKFVGDRTKSISSEEGQVGGALLDVKAEETSDDSSDEESDSSSDASVKAGQKRKRVMTPSSSGDSSSGSDSDSSSDSDSDDDKMKDVASNSSSSDSSSDSESSDDDRPLTKRTKLSYPDDEEAKFESPSDSEDDDIDSRELLKRKKQKLEKPLPAHHSSSSGSDSDSSSSGSSSGKPR